MGLIDKFFGREAQPASPWQVNFPFQDPAFRNKTSPTYLGSQLEIKPAGDNQVRISSRDTFATPVTLVGAFGRGVAACPLCRTEPKFFHDKPVSKATALAWLDHHFSDRASINDSQRAAYEQWKSQLPQSEMQGYKLTPRPESISASSAPTPTPPAA